MSLTTRERVLDAAVAMTTEEGWAKVTMARLADRVGVSRQTVHNEMGTKAGLAEAMVQRELQRFLGEVSAAFDAYPHDLVAAVRAASLAVLEHAQDNRLLHAVVSATHGADTELLPLLTTHSESLLAGAKAVVALRVAAYDVSLVPAQLDAGIDMIVRVVLSHVMQPSATPAATAESIAWVAARVLGADRPSG
ncbi:TetR/AcrR family transcriptional regulator [Nocardioides ochotonae]|uniref:TetR/AcrR family transcriptional regulator n=1 Tax=Nocardioides ochotonae TaxID=2685869 RepID=UPI0014091943|nr:TetR family transcriptional regulator [Nocardioides ochotonae]